MPAISVIMPAYNRAQLLPGAIDSVLRQDFRDFELIVVDDGSSDGSADIAGRYADPRIRLIRLDERSGANAARNAGIDAASSELLAFLDSDDSFLPHKLSTVVEMFELNSGLDLLLDSFVKLTADGARIERVNPCLSSTGEFRERLFRRQLRKPTTAITVRKAAAVRAGKFDTTVHRRQDFDFLIRVSDIASCASIDAILWEKGWSADCISECLDFIPSTLELVRRHPCYLQQSSFRAGLCRDLSRHLALLVAKRRFRQCSSDARLLARTFGTRRAATMLAAGYIEVGKRAARRSILRRKQAHAS